MVAPAPWMFRRIGEWWAEAEKWAYGPLQLGDRFKTMSAREFELAARGSLWNAERAEDRFVLIQSILLSMLTKKKVSTRELLPERRLGQSLIPSYERFWQRYS